MNRLLTRPETKRFEPFALDYPKPITLSCGIPVHIIGNGEDDVNRCSVYVRGGMMDERLLHQAQTTALHVGEAATSLPSAELAFLLDYCGAWKASQAHDDWSELTLFSLNDNFDRTFAAIAECLKTPSLDAADLELLKRRQAASLATLRKRVRYLASLEVKRLYYGHDHPLAADVTPDDVMRLTPDDTRRFHEQFYRPSHARVVLAGNITSREVDIVDRCLSSWTGPASVIPMLPWHTSPAVAPQVSVVDVKGTVQAAIAIAIKAIVRFHPDYLKLRVAVMALGGYFGSRLMTNIREEKGYTYGIHAAVVGREFDGHISISTECDPAYAWAVVREVRNEMNRMKQEPLPQEELDMVKQHMLSDLAKTLDTPFSQADYVVSTILYGVYPEYFNKQVEEVINITPADVQLMAQRYFHPDEAYMAIAGDESKMGRREEAPDKP